MKELKETHQQGTISIENLELHLANHKAKTWKGDFGIHIASDGRIWICLDGIAFLRFSTHLNGKMQNTKNLKE